MGEICESVTVSRSVGIEPTSYCFDDNCSIQVNYEVTLTSLPKYFYKELSNLVREHPVFQELRSSNLYIKYFVFKKRV